MTGRVLAGVALRVWGVVFLVGALAQLPQVVTILAQPVSESFAGMMHMQMIAVILNITVRAIVGIGLIAFGGSVANTLVPDTAPLVIDADGSDLTRIAFAVTGIVLFVHGLMEVGVVVYSGVAKPVWPPEPLPRYVWGQQREAIVRAVVEVAAGIVLVLGRAGIARTWQALRGRTSEDARGAQ